MFHTHSENSTHAPCPRAAINWFFNLDSLFLVTILLISGTLKAGLPHLLVTALPVSHSANKAQTSRQAVRGHWLTTTRMGQHLYAQCRVGGEGTVQECRTQMASASSLQSFLCVDCLPSNCNVSARTAVISSTPCSTAWHRAEAPQHTPNAQARGSVSSLTHHSDLPWEAWKAESRDRSLQRGDPPPSDTRSPSRHSPSLMAESAKLGLAFPGCEKVRSRRSPRLPP